MPACARMTPPSWEDMDTASPEVKAVDDARMREGAIEHLRHIVWCNAAKLNDQHRARIGAGLRELGVRR
jgi:hypothetical protein